MPFLSFSYQQCHHKAAFASFSFYKILHIRLGITKTLYFTQLHSKFMPLLKWVFGISSIFVETLVMKCRIIHIMRKLPFHHRKWQTLLMIVLAVHVHVWNIYGCIHLQKYKNCGELKFHVSVHGNFILLQNITGQL